MVKIVKMAFIRGLLFMSFGGVIFLQAGDLAATLEKQYAMSIERVNQKSLHERRIVFEPLLAEIDDIKKLSRGHAEKSFWIRGKAVRDLLLEGWDEVPKEPTEDERELVKAYIEAIYRLDGILNERGSLLFRILKKRPDSFYSELHSILALLDKF